MKAQDHNPSTQEAEARISWFEANLGYITEFKASLDHSINMWFCVKNSVGWTTASADEDWASVLLTMP